MTKTLTQRIEKDLETIVLEYFVDHGCAAVTAYDIAEEIAQDSQDVLRALYRLHSAGEMWTYGKSLFKPIRNPATILAEAEN